MRALLPLAPLAPVAPLALALVVLAPLLACACDQDFAASNENRESFMGSAHATTPVVPPVPSAEPAASTPAPAEVPPPPAPAPSA
ncbi:MAG: hypothetical protein ACRELB_09135, partial [Polyangiaceae bacterium]